jgi:hypothetical protein
MSSTTSGAAADGSLHSRILDREPDMTSNALPKAMVLGGLIGGALDLLFAVSSAALHGATLDRVFRVIASGWYGEAAFTGGVSMIAIGALSHFALSIVWAAIFAATARALPMLPRHPVPAGIGFGGVVFLCMRLVVLPLSAYPYPVSFKPMSALPDLISHMVLFGVPIALAVSCAIRVQLRARSDNAPASMR